MKVSDLIKRLKALQDLGGGSDPEVIISTDDGTYKLADNDDLCLCTDGLPWDGVPKVKGKIVLITPQIALADA